jgi:hypothetical protein
MLDTLIEVKLNSPGDFLKVKETLSRIGIANHERNHLTQTCHILHKRGKYYIVHFLQMFMLDGKPTHFEERDNTRLKHIVDMLVKWNLVELVKPLAVETHVSDVTIVQHKDKKNWEFHQKYTIGKG